MPFCLTALELLFPQNVLKEENIFASGLPMKTRGIYFRHVQRIVVGCVGEELHNDDKKNISPRTIIMREYAACSCAKKMRAAVWAHKGPPGPGRAERGVMSNEESARKMSRENWKVHNGGCRSREEGSFGRFNLTGVQSVADI